MPLSPVPESPKQGSGLGYTPETPKQSTSSPAYQLPRVKRASLVPLLSKLARGDSSRLSTLPTPSEPLPLDAGACAAYANQVGIGALVVAGIISGMAGAIGGYVLRSYLK